VVEVYPAAALHRWGLPYSGYKKPGQGVLDQLVAAAPWLELGEFEGLCRRSHDAFDAVVAALAARAAMLGKTVAPDARQRAAARTEGWIAVPDCELGELVS
jgi:predicted nuclease with RNAse H fold